MRYQFHGNHVEVPDQVKAYAQGKFARVSKFIDHQSDVICHITLTVMGHRHHIDVKLHVPGRELTASAEADTFLSAIDAVEDKLMHQAEKYNKQHHQHARESIRTMEVSLDD